MRNAFYVGLVAVLGAAALIVCRVESASAMPPFKKAFDARYVKPDSDNEAEKALAAGVKKVNCNVCHMGKTKKMRNAYGQALSQFVAKNEKDPAKIDEALTKVAAVKSDPDNENSPTFGELLEKGQLPAGSAEEEAEVE